MIECVSDPIFQRLQWGFGGSDQSVVSQFEAVQRRWAKVLVLFSVTRGPRLSLESSAIQRRHFLP